MILIGTSGFSYSDWKGRFYPETMPERDMLSFYSHYFPACEINSSYYRIPVAAHMATMVKKTGGKVTFVMKAHQTMTHSRDAGSTEYAAFNNGIKPLLEAGILGGILIQFPYSFTNILAHRGYIAGLKEKFSANTDIPLVVEFRHHSWSRQDAFDVLKENAFSYVNVDEPDLKGLLPATDIVTGPIGYIRFHGRNRENWFKKDSESWERYDYVYSENELKEWLPRIRKVAYQTRMTFVFFNNHWQSQAVTNAQQMAELLECKHSNPCAWDVIKGIPGIMSKQERIDERQGRLFP